MLQQFMQISKIQEMQINVELRRTETRYIVLIQMVVRRKNTDNNKEK